MSVKRYSVGVDGTDPNGNLVKYEDYAALEQKLAESQREFRAADATIENLLMQVEKLAAENAELKSIQEWAVAGVFKSGAKVFESTKASGFDTDDCLHDAVLVMLSELKTPATKAVLAEVRAQGVEMFGQYHNFSEKLFIQKEAQKFAAQLRKGVQS